MQKHDHCLGNCAHQRKKTRFGTDTDTLRKKLNFSPSRDSDADNRNSSVIPGGLKNSVHPWSSSWNNSVREHGGPRPHAKLWWANSFSVSRVSGVLKSLSRRPHVVNNYHGSETALPWINPRRTGHFNKSLIDRQQRRTAVTKIHSARPRRR